MSVFLEVLLTGWLIAAPVIPQTTPVVNIQVMVTDSRGRYISGLQPEQFAVFEDGVRQTITEFAASAGGVSVCFVPDLNNDGMLSIDAAVLALANMSAEDEFCVIDGTSTAFTGNRDEVEKRLRSLRSGQTSPLTDALQAAKEAMKAARNPLKAAFVLSDRAAEIPSQNASGNPDVPTYVLSTTGTSPFLDEIAVSTGGNTFAIKTADDAKLYGVRALIGVRNSYVIGFRSLKPAGDGSFRKVAVEYVPLKGISRLDFNYRTGYFAR